LTGGVEAGEVVVRVRDTGVGIPAEMLPRVFDWFTQVDSSRGRAKGGMSIGLALVRGLMEAHGGTVHAGNHRRRQPHDDVDLLVA